METNLLPLILLQTVIVSVEVFSLAISPRANIYLLGPIWGDGDDVVIYTQPRTHGFRACGGRTRVIAGEDSLLLLLLPSRARP